MVSSLVIFISYVLIIHCLMNKSRSMSIKKAPQRIVVLGYCLQNGQVSELLKARLQLGATLAKTYEEAMIVVTGGKSTKTTASEADVMKQYLMTACDISPERIIIEDYSKNTIENLCFSRPIWQGHQTIIISNEFHTVRIKLLLHYFKFNADIIGAKTPSHLRLTQEPREHAALIKEVFYCMIDYIRKKKNEFK